MPGIEIIDNQPVSFNNDLDDCSFPSRGKYVQLVNTGDVTQFQIKIAPCSDAENVIINGDFDVDSDWTLGDGWTISDGKLCRDDATGSSSASQSSVGGPGLFQFTIVVDDVQGSFTVLLAGIDFSVTLGTITSPGTYTFTGFVIEDSDIFIFGGSQETICISYIEGFNIPLPRVSVYTSDGSWVKTYTPESTGDPDPFFVFLKDSMTFTMDWLEDIDPSNGCYYICLHDPCINTNGQNSANLITNGDFSDSAPPTNWTTTVNALTSLGISNGQMQYDSTSNSGHATAESDAVLIEGLCYDISYTVQNVLPVPLPIAAARVRLVVGPFIGSWQNAGGTYTEQFTYVSGLVTLEFESTFNDEPAHRIAVDDVICTVCDESLTCHYRSNNFKYGSHDCTHLINACNDSDGIGFVFSGSGFSPRIRLKSTLVRGKYNIDRRTFEDSAGRADPIYFRRRKFRELRIEPAVAEYVHDFLSTLGGYHHVYIDGPEYFIEDDEYNVNYETRNDIEAKAIINVSEKIQLVESKNCSGLGEGCQIEASCLIDPQGDIIVDPVTGDCVLAI